jgi:hypothetical protein
MTKDELIEQIRLETRLVHNIQRWSYTLLAIGCIPAFMLYQGWLKILAFILLLLCISLGFVTGLGAYRGKKRVEKMIALLREILPNFSLFQIQMSRKAHFFVKKF